MVESGADGIIHRANTLRWAVWVVPHCADHRQEIRTCLHKRGAIFCSDSANRNGGNFKHFIPPSENVWPRTMHGLFGFGWVEGAKRHIIRAKIASFHRKVA